MKPRIGLELLLLLMRTEDGDILLFVAAMATEHVNCW